MHFIRPGSTGGTIGSGIGGGGGHGPAFVDKLIEKFGGAFVSSDTRYDNHILKALRNTATVLMVADCVLTFVGVFAWPELAFFAIGIIGLAWAMSNFSPFKTKEGAEDNKFTRIGSMAKTYAAVGAPAVAFAVAVFPAITYRLGAGVLDVLLIVGTVILGIGKALDIKAIIASLSLCAVLAVAVIAGPPPGNSGPFLRFEADPATDVKLTFKLERPAGQSNAPRQIIGYSCFAILPQTWFKERPFVYLNLASTYYDSEPEVELPYSPLGYVIKARVDDVRVDGPVIAEVEVKNVVPLESRDVVIKIQKE